MMTEFEKHIGRELPQAVLEYFSSTPKSDLDRKANKLKFDAWCPVVLENDSKELREELKQASELIFQYLEFTREQ